MARRILLLQADLDASRALAQYFTGKGDQILSCTEVGKAVELFKKREIDLVFIDLHLPGKEWLKFLTYVRKVYPGTKVIVTNKHSDLHRARLSDRGPAHGGL